MSKHITPENYLDNTAIPVQYIGTEALTGPVQRVSAPRITLNSKSASQACTLINPEPPLYFTGFESLFGDYTFDQSPIPHEDVIVLRVIPKYNRYAGESTVIKNPLLTVFYRGVDTGLIGHFDVPDYRMLSSGFGYDTIKPNTSQLVENNRLQKGSVFSHSPAKIGDCYCMGVNLNVCYISTVHTTEDPIAITRNAYNKLARMGFQRSSITLKEDMIPTTPIPEIGQVVPPDGILLALRPFNINSLFEYTAEELQRCKMGDTIYTVEGGSVVRDIDVFVNHSKLQEISNKDSAYYPFYRYQMLLFEYYREFIKIYNEYHQYKFHPHTWNLIMAYSILLPKSSEWLTENTNLHPSKFDYGGSRMSNLNRVPYDRKTAIDFIHVRVTTSNLVRASEVHKLTNRYGNKGVVPKIIEDEDALVDEEGFVADCILSPDSPVNRLNPEQLAELDYNRLSLLVVKDTMDWPVERAYAHFIQYLKDFNLNYGTLMDQTFCNEQAEFVASCRKNSIPLHMPGTLKERTPETDAEFFAKYNYRKSRASYNYEIVPGHKLKINIDQPIAIGPMYMYLLNKDPAPSATELGYVNSHMLPTKIKGGGKSLGTTPIRTGEQETLIQTQALDPSKIARTYAVSGQNPTATKDMYVDIMEAEVPSAYQWFNMSDQELIAGGVSLNILQHILAIAGIDISPETYYSQED